MRAARTAALLALACQGGTPPPPPPASAVPTPPRVERSEPAAPVPESPFPTPEKLEDLARERAPEKLADARFVDADAWTLAGPFPERAGEEPIEAPGALEAMLLDHARGRAGLLVVSESMRCAAREIGRFFLERDGPPAAGLQRYMLGRCGATGTGAALGWLPGLVPPDAPEASVATAWNDGIRRLIAERLGPGPRAAGIWFGSRGEDGLVLFVSAPRAAHLDPVTLVGDSEGRIRVQGELLAPAEDVGAMVNRGRVGFAECEPEPAVALPRFAFSCPTQRGDASAWIGVGARRPGRLLPDTALLLLARPGGGEAKTWKRTSYVGSVLVAEPADLRARLVEALNRLRESEGLAPLGLEERESETATQLAPFYFGASLDLLPPAWSDLATLGLLAGWQVAGTIRDGGVAGSMVLGTRDLDRWLADAIEQPGARSVLFDAEKTRVAVGPVISTEHEYLGVLIASYALFGPEDTAKLRQSFYARLDRAFDAHGKAFPSRDRDAEAAADRHLARVAGGAATPERAVSELLAELGASRRGAARGWWLEGNAADDVVLPDDLFAAPAERLAAAVGHYRPEGWPWGRVIVLLVTTTDATQRTARASPR